MSLIRSSGLSSDPPIPLPTPAKKKKKPMIRPGVRTHSLWEAVVECRGSATVRMLRPREAVHKEPGPGALVLDQGLGVKNEVILREWYPCL